MKRLVVAALAVLCVVLSVRLPVDLTRARDAGELSASSEESLRSIRTSATTMRRARGAVAEVSLENGASPDGANVPAVLEGTPPESLAGGWVRRSWRVEFPAIDPAGLRHWLIEVESTGVTVVGLELAFPSSEAPGKDLYSARAILVQDVWRP